MRITIKKKTVQNNGLVLVHFKVDGKEKLTPLPAKLAEDDKKLIELLKMNLGPGWKEKVIKEQRELLVKLNRSK